MCGIVGAIAFGKLNKKDEKIQQRLMRYLTTELMLETEERGKDATGAAVLFADGNYTGVKRGEESSKFLAKFGSGKERYGSILEIWRKHTHPAKVYLGHCRKGTIGDKEDNENNHPIKIKNIVGVHNGVIRNDSEIEKYLGCKRDGKVDSEVIFRLFDHFTNSGKEPFTMHMLENLIARLTGAFAVMAFNADNLNQLPMFRDGRPFEMIFIKDLSLMIIVSELKFWSRVHFRYERMIEYGEVKLPSLLDMEIVKETFKDDTAVIFDLNVKCTKDTGIEDLGEFKKILRDNKTWTTIAALNTSNRVGTGSYASGQKMAKTESEKREKAEGEAKKRIEESTKKTEQKDNSTDAKADDNKGDEQRKRVFDSITKKYEVQGTPSSKSTKLDKEESKVIPTEPANKERDKVNPSIDKETKDLPKVDSVSEDTPAGTLKLDDRTDYGVYVKDDGIGSDRAIEASFTEVKEVDMTMDPPELTAKAAEMYKALPDDKRGYGNMEILLTDVDIHSELIARDLGLKIVSNRVARLQWGRGFIDGWKACLGDNVTPDKKTELRERHIDGLKSMVIMLAQFFARSKSESRRRSQKAEDSLMTIAENHMSKRPSFNMEKLSGIFNDHESGKIKEARTILNTVSKIANEGEHKQ